MAKNASENNDIWSEKIFNTPEHLVPTKMSMYLEER